LSFLLYNNSNMKCILIYYTGTYNTRYLTNLIKDRFEKKDITCDTYEINPLNNEILDLSKYDLIGLGYPIYGFNSPYPFLKFIRKQKFKKGVKTFIYKNSGETYHANDASSINIYRKLKHDKAIIKNEYHFIMPYNIHFRFKDELVKEMLDIDNLLLDILEYEVLNNIDNIKRYKFIHKLITFVVKLQYIGGPVNSYLYKVKTDKCIKCNMCIDNCPTKNIYYDNKGNIKFHHNCLMCMRCSFHCPKDAIHIGFLDDWGWRANGKYDFDKILKLENKEPIINDNTKGFFKCYIETYKNIKKRHNEIFNGGIK